DGGAQTPHRAAERIFCRGRIKGNEQLAFSKGKGYNNSNPYTDMLPKGSMLFREITSYNVDFAKFTPRKTVREEKGALPLGRLPSGSSPHFAGVPQLPRVHSVPLCQDGG